MRKHLTNELKYTCGVCQKDYKSIEDAKDHAMNVCGSIHEKGATQERVISENIHECKTCQVKFNSNSILVKHIKENHVCVDCNKCNSTFKSQEDVYKHANNCSEICEPNMCNYCNMELVSKAGLIKHMDKCRKKHSDASGKEGRKEKCTNGPSCQYHKEDRCRFEHDTAGEQPWKLVKTRMHKKHHNIHHNQQPKQQQHSRTQHKALNQLIPKHHQKMANMINPRVSVQMVQHAYILSTTSAALFTRNQGRTDQALASRQEEVLPN